jgi:hypothetical protein
MLMRRVQHIGIPAVLQWAIASAFIFHLPKYIRERARALSPIGHGENFQDDRQRECWNDKKRVVAER